MQPNPNAMVLATADQQGAPSARVVLCKEIRPDTGYMTFFTNYQSRKGTELSANPRAAAVMYWDVLHRQVRLEGAVTPTTAAESDAYFASRAWQSRIGAWASQQSAPIASRAELERATRARRRGASACPRPPPSDDAAPDPGVAIPRPPHWGGYQLVGAGGGAVGRGRWRGCTIGRAGPAGSSLPAAASAAGRWSATRLQP